VKPLIVLTTVGENYDARALAKTLVEQHLAACVNILPNLFSVYRWQGKITGDYEQILLIKTDSERLVALQETLLGEHPYDVPEFVIIPIETVPGPYADWLAASLSGETSRVP